MEASAKRDTFGDKCAMCGKKVYVLERHFEGTTLYHRRCIRGSQRAASFGKAGETNGQTGREEFGKKEKENRVPPNGPSSLLIQVNGGPKPYVSAREDEGKKSDTNGTTGTSSLLSKLRGPAPYKGEAAMTPPKARQVDVQKTDWNKFLGVSAPGKTGHTRGVEKMDVDDDVPPPLPLSKQPPKKPPRMLETSSTVVEKAQTAPVERFKRVTEEEPKTAKKDTRMLHEKPENAAVLSGLLKSLSHVRHDGSPGTSGPHAGSQAATSQFTLIKTTSPVSKPDIKKRNDDSHITLTHTTGKPTPFGSVEQSGTSKSDTIGSVATKKVDSSQELKAKINTFEHAKDGSESKGRDSPAFCSSYKTTGQKPASSVPVSVESAKSSKRPQLNSYLKSTSGNDKLNKRPTVIRPPASILKNGSNNSQAQRTQPNGVDHRDSEDVNTTSVTESHVKTHGPDAQVVAGNNFSAFNINDSVELDSSKSSGKGEGKEREKKEEREKNGEREEREQTGKKEERKQKGEREGKGEKAVRGKPTWQVEVEARGGKIPRQQVPKHGKKELGGGDAAGSETDWQREARRREAARGGRYADPEKKQVHIIKASPSKNSPEPEQMGSPAERTGSPAEHIGSPAERTRSPAERTGLLAERTGSPAERTGSPAERMGSPAERTGSPAERMGSPKTTHLKRGEVFYIKEKTVGDVSPRPVDKDKTVEKESPGKTDWQLEAERRQSNQRHKDEATCPTPAPRNISRPTPGVSTELARPPSESVVVDKPARVRVKPRAVKTQWYVDAEKRKTTASGVDPGKTVEYTEVGTVIYTEVGTVIYTEVGTVIYTEVGTVIYTEVGTVIYTEVGTVIYTEVGTVIYTEVGTVIYTEVGTVIYTEVGTVIYTEVGTVIYTEVGTVIYTEVGTVIYTEVGTVIYTEVGTVIYTEVGTVIYTEVGTVIYTEVGTVIYTEVGTVIYTEVGTVIYTEVGPVIYTEVGTVIYTEVGTVIYTEVGTVIYTEVGTVIYTEVGTVIYTEVGTVIYTEVGTVIYTEVGTVIYTEVGTVIYTEVGTVIYTEVGTDCRD